MNPDSTVRVAVVGLGYVGLPLAVAFGQQLPTIGFDTNPERILELGNGLDRNSDVLPDNLFSPQLSFTCKQGDLVQANVFIIAVPTPVDRGKRPDLSYLLSASTLVGRVLKARNAQGAICAFPPLVVYESTVYPGCTEEVCIPALEEESGLRSGSDFKVGYSPERINPGDSEHTLENIVKVVGGQDEQTTERMAELYGLIIKAGVHRTSNIQTAEAAKVIENIQRDLNIALMNELAKLFKRLQLDTQEVLRAANTKWNFLPFKPGLVGGHCIPVDPYYLTQKAQEAGYHPEVILAGRRINDSMGRYVAEETVKLLIKAGKAVQGARVLVLGATFKENVADLRNTRVVDLVKGLEEYGIKVMVHDPLADAAGMRSYGLSLAQEPFDSDESYDGLVIAVRHKVFEGKPHQDFIHLLTQSSGIIMDLNGLLSGKQLGRGVIYSTL